MEKQIQERRGTWRLLIGSILVFCAPISLTDALAAPPTGSAGKIVNAADVNVPYATIQAAIDAAKDGDAIILLGKAGGNTIYRERIDFKGKAVTVRSGNTNDPNDPTLYPETTFILGTTSSGSVVTFANGEDRDSVLKGLTIGWGTADYGAGIRCENASPTITQCIITNNKAKYYGGGIDCYGGSPLISHCTISENSVTGVSGIGGGINCEEATATISECIIRNNTSANLDRRKWPVRCGRLLSNHQLLHDRLGRHGPGRRRHLGLWRLQPDDLELHSVGQWGRAVQLLRDLLLYRRR
jgi:hypothetical protein